MQGPCPANIIRHEAGGKETHHAPYEYKINPTMQAEIELFQDKLSRISESNGRFH